MIILNEKRYAENCTENGIVGEKPRVTLQILSKYYYHQLGYRKEKIAKLLTEYLQNYYPRYPSSKVSWANTIEKIAKDAGKYPLYQIDAVWITDGELHTIDNINGSEEERKLAFTLLCLAKLGNMRDTKNNSWVSIDAKELMELANITGTRKNCMKILSRLHGLGLIDFPKKNGNLSNRITFIDDNSAKTLSISDFRSLGYAYLKHNGENIIQCASCGILTRGSKNGLRKYCPSCKTYKPAEDKAVICIDCGKEIIVPARNTRTCRCDDCNAAYRRKYNRENKRKIRHSQDCPQTFFE